MQARHKYLAGWAGLAVVAALVGGAVVWALKPGLDEQVYLPSRCVEMTGAGRDGSLPYLTCRNPEGGMSQFYRMRSGWGETHFIR